MQYKWCGAWANSSTSFILFVSPSLHLFKRGHFVIEQIQ